MTFTRIALLGACALVAHTGAASARPVPGTPCTVLPADNIWNRDISAMPVHSRSAAWLQSTNAGSARLHPDFGGEYGLPYDVVSSSHPFVDVEFLWPDEADLDPYPFGSDIAIEGGDDADGDRHATMIDEDSCSLYELYDAHWGSTPEAASGAIFDLRSNALRPRGWTSADAAGLPIFPGLVRWDEVLAGEIKHAIRMTVQRSDRSYVWPARHQAGAASDANLPPMGARFRLKAGYDLSGFSANTRVVLTAMKRYGMIVADNGSNWYFQGTQTASWPSTLISELKSVPASAFEAVDTSSLMVNQDSGQAKGPAGSTSTWSINFTRVRVRSVVRTVKLKASGTAPLVVGATSIAGSNAADFVVDSNACTGTTLAPGSSCTIGLRFIPTALGTRTAELSIAHSAADGRATVKLSGTGIQ